MDKRKSVLNVLVAICSKVIVLVGSIVTRSCLIKYCGNESNGLNDLYISILGFFAIAELGVGSAIAFCMYRPIVNGEEEKVAALYHLLRRLYWLVGGVIFLGGLCITPFLHIFAKDYVHLSWNLQGTFLLMLISVVITYLYSAETTLLNAYKNNYITTAITSLGMLLQQFLQILVLTCTGSFPWYLACRILTALAQWLVLRCVTRKKYRQIITRRASLEKDTRLEVVKNVRALFMHKIGNFLVNTVDSIVVSTFVGVLMLGAYSNYTTIMNAGGNLLRLGFSSLTSIIGHLHVEKSKQITRNYCDLFHLINFALGAVFYLGYYAVVDDMIAILFHESLILEKSVSMAITMNGFVQFLRHSTLMFRDATGTFYYDRWKPLLEGLANLLLSIWLVNTVGVAGVIIATVITNLLICHVVEPYVLYRHAFGVSPKAYYVQNYGMILVFFGGLLVLDSWMQQAESHVAQLLMNGCISVVVSVAVCLVVLMLNYKKLKRIAGQVKGKQTGIPE